MNKQDKVVSDGTTASYYELPPQAKELQELISYKNMNAQLGEIFRECYRYGEASHCDMLRGINKILFYAQAEKERLTNYAAVAASPLPTTLPAELPRRQLPPLADIKQPSTNSLKEVFGLSCLGPCSHSTERAAKLLKDVTAHYRYHHSEIAEYVYSLQVPGNISAIEIPTDLKNRYLFLVHLPLSREGFRYPAGISLAQELDTMFRGQLVTRVFGTVLEDYAEVEVTVLPSKPTSPAAPIAANKE